MSESAHQEASSPSAAPAVAAEQPRPSFEPLFTLLTNASTNTTIHPRVTYLFSDDDPSILPASSTPSDRSMIVDLVPQGSKGWSVSWAGSLSEDFAVTGASLTQGTPSSVAGGNLSGQNTSAAPAGGEGGQTVGQGDGESVLRIEGVEREPVEVLGAVEGSGASGMVEEEDVEGLMEDFKRRMGVLQRVVGEGERRRDVLRKGETEEEQQQQAEQLRMPGEEADEMRDSDG